MLKFQQLRIKLGALGLPSAVLLLAIPVAMAAHEVSAPKDSTKSETHDHLHQENNVKESAILKSKALSVKSDVQEGEIVLAVSKAKTSKVWTLENSIKEAIKVSPNIIGADDEIDARKGALSQAGAWPNPSIGVTGSQKLGLQNGRRGANLTQFSVSQPIPLGRLSYQSNQAKAELEASKYWRNYEQLIQENSTAHYFHALQLAEIKLDLANEKLHFAQHYHNNSGEKDPLIRYLDPLESKRLDIVRETAKQEVTIAAQEYEEALSNFKAFLYLQNDAVIRTATLKPIYTSASLQELLSAQEKSHAAIVASKYEKEAADMAVSVTRSKRFEDPTITFTREKDYFDGVKKSYNSVSVGITIPLWDTKKGEVSRAKSEARKAVYKLDTQKRTLQTKLTQSYMRLSNLIKQSNQHNTKMLKPAKEVFDLTQKGFSAGEVNLLSLIDASDIYFEARKHYLELLYESNIQAANVQLAAGMSLLTNNITVSSTKVGVKP